MMMIDKGRDKQAMINWARQVLEGALILDTETTGLSDGEIVQLSVINNVGTVLLDTLVKPVHPIPADATAVHGITDAMVDGAPVWSVVSDQLVSLLKDRRILIYNAVYDRKMMHQSAEKARLPRVEWNALATFECVMLSYAQFWGEWGEWHQTYRWQRLTHACVQQRIDQSLIIAPAHSALGDCLRTLALVKAMAGM